MEENDKCPNCKKGTLKIVKANEPYTEEHLQCDNCDSTFNIE